MKIYDLIGIGIGPSNLSTASLLYPLKSRIDAIFFDNKKEFSWHPGLMFPDAKLQVSILKDLVTMLDPTSRFSFLNYLKKTNKIYMFAAKNGFNNIKRREFEDYFKWVISKLDCLHFNLVVENVSYNGDFFVLSVNNKIYNAKNIVMGAGLTSNIPAFCKQYISSTLFHSSQFLKEYNNYTNKEVVIIGGGQSSCEIIKFILQQDLENLPSKLNWIFKNYNLNVLEDNPFTNEFYTPNYSNYFYSLDNTKKKMLIKQQKFTSDGVSEETLNEIYNLLYDYKVFSMHKVFIYNESSLVNIDKKNNKYLLDLSSGLKLSSDVVILGTGFYYKMPECIKNLSHEFQTLDDVFIVDEKYRLIPKSNNIKGQIFIHNGAKHIRGVADPNLSLLAWRSGIIINTLLGEEIYDVNNERSILEWEYQK